MLPSTVTKSVTNLEMSKAVVPRDTKHVFGRDSSVTKEAGGSSGKDHPKRILQQLEELLDNHHLEQAE